jgi:hypothetical protein
MRQQIIGGNPRAVNFNLEEGSILPMCEKVFMDRDDQDFSEPPGIATVKTLTVRRHLAEKENFTEVDQVLICQ